MHGISTRSGRRPLCEEIDERVQAFLSRPIEGHWPYLWIAWERRSQAYLKSRQGGRVVSVAVIVAVAVNTDGRARSWAWPPAPQKPRCSGP